MLSQPNFQKQYDEGNFSFRIPTPVFGAGLVEAIDENTIIANMNATTQRRTNARHLRQAEPQRQRRSITRFGWKAQNKSLLMFASEAYNVEMGVTNEIMPNERGYPPNPIPTQCLFNPVPEDFTVASPMTSDPLSTLSDVEQFVFFMRFLDQPKQDPNGIPGNPSLTSIANGSSNFVSVGCTFCHTPSMTTTTKSDFAPAALQGVQANLFSDLLLHHMGKGLEDGITQGQAGPDQFRTAPLWGLGQRIFFLHDGRCADLVCAIEAHKSEGSEANKVIHNLDKLTTQQQQDLLNFLRSL